jgi:predicted alpha/beta hydrolase
LRESVTFAGLDGYPLEGSLYGQPHTAHTALLMNSATGIPRGFYRRFCQRAAELGFLVLSYDYRGIGGSAPPSLRKCDAVYRDWGQLDLPAALDFLQAEAPELPLVAVGHSTGGQQLGLSDRVSTVRAALFVAVSTGYWRGMPGFMRWQNLALWRLFAPVCTRVLGYFPSRLFGLGENLPVGVAREWGDWCLQPDYMAAYFDETGRYTPRDGRPFGPQHFEDARFPVRSVNFEDDPISSKKNVPPLLAMYTRATIDVQWHHPKSFNTQSVGHLGFFRKAHAAQWDAHLLWLQANAHTNQCI